MWKFEWCVLWTPFMVFLLWWWPSLLQKDGDHNMFWNKNELPIHNCSRIVRKNTRWYQLGNLYIIAKAGASVGTGASFHTNIHCAILPQPIAWPTWTPQCIFLVLSIICTYLVGRAVCMWRKMTHDYDWNDIMTPEVGLFGSWVSWQRVMAVCFCSYFFQWRGVCVECVQLLLYSELTKE